MMGKVIMYEAYTPRQFSGSRPPVSGSAFQVRQAARTCRATTARGLTLGQAIEKYDACMVRALRAQGPAKSRKRSTKKKRR